ncbi:hypothetical protein RHGRI_036858 [Rhododendron griersonianum]|uniref:Dolichyl-diphosphooligosaccharide-protein glycosyltransferase subunit OST5 n=1 Tax=Rhododendron griersonianum TaxID=479676 RepID=A0AAV6HSU1_9ERIC|nr:hypothetical protein RHGRI_036858 [Rhododendron griersonianum]
MGQSVKPISSPVPDEWFPTLAVLMLAIGLIVTASFFIKHVPISESSSDGEDDDDDAGDNNGGLRTNSLKDKGGESRGVLEGDATSVVFGTNNQQTNQHRDKTKQNVKSLTQEDGRSREENSKSLEPLDNGVSRVEDSVDLNEGRTEGLDINEVDSNLALRSVKDNGPILNSEEMDLVQKNLGPNMAQKEAKIDSGAS